jgi:Tfp pilus assembly protein PilV
MAALEPPRARADTGCVRLPASVRTRLRSQAGFGLLELLISMTLLNIAILALVAAFNSGAIALQRASRTSTAAALADTQMERYRALTYAAIALSSSAVATTDTLYRNDAVLGGNIANDLTTSTGCTASPLPNECNPSRIATGADRHSYRVDTYITARTPTNGRTEKLVTIVVRRGTAPYSTLARQQSAFDLSTGS